MIGSPELAGSLPRLRIVIALVVVSRAIGAASVAVPSANCYALDNASRLVDFSSWIGHVFLYDGGTEADLTVQLCKDVETWSNSGFVNFGRFDKFNYFTAGSGHIDFVQRFYNGDLRNCERRSYDKLGRTAQNKPNRRGKVVEWSEYNLRELFKKPMQRCLMTDEHGCICNVTYKSPCRVLVEIAIPCKKEGPRIFEGFTVGFHPRSWEIVYNGLTQPGFEKSYPDFSFRTEQAHVALYMTAISSHSNLVQKPNVKVFPENGLDVKLSGSAMTGRYPTTLSPTTLILDWRCETPHDSPYEVEITIPVDGYEPVHFTLSKICEHREDTGGDAIRGWAVFGILSCICIILSTLLCIGGLVYKIRVEHQRGLDALPGITILSACLETVSGGRTGYSRAEEINSAFANQASWEQPQDYNYAAKQSSGRAYGSF